MSKSGPDGASPEGVSPKGVSPRGVSPRGVSPKGVSPDFGPAAFQRATGVSHETMAGLTRYASLLQRWNRSINLVSPPSLPALWWRHMLDSAQLLALAPADARRWLDIGSGGGFPGMVLALMLRERTAEPPPLMHLVESHHRKAAFLREAARQTGAPVRVYACRIETLADPDAFDGAMDVITARACAPLPRLLQWAEPFFGEGTVGLFPIGQNIVGKNEKDTICSVCSVSGGRFTMERLASRTAPSAGILRVRFHPSLPPTVRQGKP